jgi:hypothetical protein
MTIRRSTPVVALIAVLLLAVVLPVPAQKKAHKPGKSPKKVALQKPTLWHDPGKVEELDFVGGPGGRAAAPRPPFRFIEEDKGGTNPKIKVTDATGRVWGVKWGQEIHSEVFASRLVWAVGYTVEANYFIKSGQISGVSDLTRARKYVSSGGSFTNARFELKDRDIKKQTDQKSWSWKSNPFVGTPQLNGLKIMIMLTSNWDPKDQTDTESNTAIYTNKKTGEVVYVVSDWGATMGKWGGFFSREKWDCDGFASQTHKFVTGVKAGRVRFGYEGKHTGDMREGIRVGDVRWLLGYLGRITSSQIRDGLNAAGATQDEADCFVKALRERIDELKRAVR